jgi:hypothetical protein
MRITRIVLKFLLLVGLMSCELGGSPDYDYKTIIGDSPYGAWKQDRAQAMESARSGFESFAKSECRRAIANGWSLFEVKNEGVMNCERTPEGHHCRKKGVELECREISEFFP